MDKGYVKELLKDISSFASNGNIKEIIATCQNTIETIEQLETKSELINACVMIEDAKYELTKLPQNEETDKIYSLLNDTTIQLRKIILKKNELSSSDQTE